MNLFNVIIIVEMAGSTSSSSSTDWWVRHGRRHATHGTVRPQPCKLSNKHSVYSLTRDITGPLDDTTNSVTDKHSIVIQTGLRLTSPCHTCTYNTTKFKHKQTNPTQTIKPEHSEWTQRHEAKAVRLCYTVLPAESSYCSWPNQSDSQMRWNWVWWVLPQQLGWLKLTSHKITLLLGQTALDSIRQAQVTR